MPFIHSVARELPQNYYSQDELIEAFLKHWDQRFFNPRRLLDFQKNVLVKGRYLALPMEAYEKLNGFGSSNKAWLETALQLSVRAVSDLLETAGLAGDDIYTFFSTTGTGITIPSLEARLMNHISFRPDMKRVPIFGLGCLGGVAGINRLGDYLKAHPSEAGILLAVELCSLTLQREDISIANIIASGLFGDGCAAVLMVGDEHPLRENAAFEWSHPRSAFFPNSEHAMGWEIVDSGFKIILSPEVPDFVTKKMPTEIAALLKSAGIEKMPDFYVTHPGGPKVLQAMEQALDLDKKALEKSWKSLAEFGNMSSTSVLFILKDTIDDPPARSSLGIMAALGPAFCAELNLLRRP